MQFLSFSLCSTLEGMIMQKHCCSLHREIYPNETLGMLKPVQAVDEENRADRA